MLREVFEYALTRIDPVRGDHVDPPSVAIFETLMRKGPDGTPLPGLATSWSVDADGLTWRLRIRDGARFHSGADCDARAVAQALELCRWAEGLPRQVWYWDPVDTLSVDDERTVSLRLHYPCRRLPVLLWGTHTAIMNPDPWRRLGDDFGTRSADGTGPYRLVSFTSDEVIADRAAPGPGPDRIAWQSRPDDDHRRAALDDESVDIVRYVDGAGTGWHLSEQHEGSQFYLALDFGDARGFGDVEVRRGIDAFIDRERILEVALGGRGDARRSPIPVADEFAAAYDPAAVAPLSRDRAKAVLADRGWSRGSDGVLMRDGVRMSLDCVIQDTAVCRAIAEELARQLRAEGIELRLDPHQPFEPFYRAAEAGPACFVSKWLWPDAMEAVMGFSREDCIEPGGGNWQSARCATVDAAYDAFLRATTAEDAMAASAAAQREFMTHLPYIPLVSTLESVAVRPRVRGFELRPRTLYPSYDGIDLAEDRCA